MVEYTDPETGETISRLVDKVKKKKITPLKRAILRKRERLLRERTKKVESDKSFETIEENDDENYVEEE